MAYAALASFSHTIDLILKYHQDAISVRLENQIIYIQIPVKTLQTFLEASPDTDGWFEGRITEVMHEAEDAVEILVLEQALGSSNSTSFHHLENVTKKIESVVREMNSLTGGIEDVRIDNRSIEFFRVRDRLRTEPYDDLDVIAIVGMERIGKTSLALQVYLHSRGMQHFDFYGWARVSRGRIFLEIVSELLVCTGEFVDVESDELGFMEVFETLFGRKYLVVLDDLWDTEDWDVLGRMFPNNGNGSRIIVTTRFFDVASYVDVSRPIYLSCMDENRSWILLHDKVFKGGSCPINLWYIGKRITRLCRGKPLVISLVSGVLAADLTKDFWEGFAGKMNAANGYDEDDDAHLSRILFLSYTYLPRPLRSCFLYMAAFPEDEEIRVSNLIKLWVAEGFLEPYGSESLEETAEECLEDLVRRNLLSVTKRKRCGRMKFVSLPSIVRVLCIQIAREEEIFEPDIGILEEGIDFLARRLTIVGCFNPGFLESIHSWRIRTIICMENIPLPCSLRYFTLLRILVLSNCSSSLFPVEIFHLFHLRYLAFDSLFDIPAAISNLRNLQTLIIHSPDYLMLPGEIWSMPQLRHLLVYCCISPSRVTFTQNNMQTLLRVLNLICSKERLNSVPNLKRLMLCYTAWSGDDLQLHNLIHLQKLEDLKIEAFNFPPMRVGLGVAYPETLKKLSLSGLGVPWSAMATVGSLPNLEVLKLRNDACIGDTWETREGGFPRLTLLLIDRSDVRVWRTESSHLPRLRSLVLRGCWNLRGFPMEIIGGTRTLQLIEVDDTNNPLVEVDLMALEQQGYDDLRILMIRNSVQSEW